MQTKTFDCVRMKREIQQRFNDDTRALSQAERDELMKQRAAAFRKSIEASPGKGNFKALFEALEREQERRGNL